MARHWTDAQKSAIELHGKTILVSAAAGSGKTAALTERIIQTLLNSALSPESYRYKTDISKIIVVTFTRAAAAELRERISKALSEALAKYPDNEYLRKQIILLPSAKICTIDAFYVDTVRTNFSRLSISSSFRIADKTELKVIYGDIMNEVIEEYYNKSDGIDFASFADNFTGLKNDGTLNEILLAIYSDLTKYPEGISLINTYADEYTSCCKDDIFSTKFGMLIKERIERMLLDFIEICNKTVDNISYDEVLYKAYAPAFNADRVMYNTILDAVKKSNYNEAHNLTSNYKYKRLGDTKKIKEPELRNKYTSLRNSMKEKMKKIAALLSPSMEDNCHFIHMTAEIFRKLYMVLSDYEERVKSEKALRNIFDFSDITNLMLKLVLNPDGTKTETAKEISAQFDEIYIDEYQDTNFVQDAIFRAISRDDNRFMVGDIKQSIYSFRGAEPDVFLGYRNYYPKLSESTDKDTGVSIFMSNNFRCDENIIKFINAISTFTFGLCNDSINYSSDDDLIYSKTAPHDNYQSPIVNFTLIETNNSHSGAQGYVQEIDNGSNYEDIENDIKSNESQKADINEYHYIAKEIIHLLKAEKSISGCPLKPSDIAVLVRTQNQINVLNEIFAQYNIKSVSPQSNDLFRTPDVLLMTAYMNVIDNPTNDIELTALLRSPIFNLTLDELIEIRRYGIGAASLYEDILTYIECETAEASTRAKCLFFVEKLNKYRIIAQSMPVDKLLRIIYRDPTCAFVGDSASLVKFYEYARKFESGSFRGLYNFVRYIENVKNQALETNSEFVTSSDAVIVMNIHKSKGLEFPVCFVAGMSHKFNLCDLRKSYVFDKNIGAAMRLSDNTGLVRYNTIIRSAVNLKKEVSMMQEEMRILYVALTRAKERLYVSGCVKNADSFIDDCEQAYDMPDYYGNLIADSYLPWITKALCIYEHRNNSDLYKLLSGISKNSFCRMTIYNSDESANYNEDISEQITLNATDNNITTQTNDFHSLEDDYKILIQTFEERFNFRYLYDYMTDIPAKLSVSRLLPEILDGFDKCDSPIHYGVRNKINLEFDFGNIKPACAPTAAEKGTATHLLLQFCDYDYIKKYGADAEIQRLVEYKYIPESTAKIVRRNEFEIFTHSELFKRIYSAKKVYREQRFNLNYKAADFSANELLKRKLEESHELLLVQGVIDIFFIDINDKIVLCDYKTDRIPKEIVNDDDKIKSIIGERHSEQLKYYKYAVSELCGRLPDEILVYLTQTGRTYRIDC